MGGETGARQPFPSVCDGKDCREPTKPWRSEELFDWSQVEELELFASLDHSL